MLSKAGDILLRSIRHINDNAQGGDIFHCRFVHLRVVAKTGLNDGIGDIVEPVQRGFDRQFSRCAEYRQLHPTFFSITARRIKFKGYLINIPPGDPPTKWSVGDDAFFFGLNDGQMPHGRLRAKAQE
ncbi:MAG: hypothetical protein HOM25_01485 [Rhodospirillaceae bacterium]|nr:hypothetical protein [Rhodospirillaceae bacterium]